MDVRIYLHQGSLPPVDFDVEDLSIAIRNHGLLRTLMSSTLHIDIGDTLRRDTNGFYILLEDAPQAELDFVSTLPGGKIEQVNYLLENFEPMNHWLQAHTEFALNGDDLEERARLDAEIDRLEIPNLRATLVKLCERESVDLDVSTCDTVRNVLMLPPKDAVTVPVTDGGEDRTIIKRVERKIMAVTKTGGSYLLPQNRETESFKPGDRLAVRRVYQKQLCCVALEREVKKGEGNDDD